MTGKTAGQPEQSTSPVVLVERADRAATVTLNRPAARNAISVALLQELRATMAGLEADDGVDGVVLTSADPAYCAGLDLKELGGAGDSVPVGSGDDGAPTWFPWAPISKPVIGAVTGGLELALNCDILIASERARFADTHARVGVLPGWGLSVLLPLVVGRGLARRMSLTGDYISAEQALRAGLVTEVAAHDDLVPAARRVATSIVGNDQCGVRTLLRSYRDIEVELVGAGPTIEAATSAAWMAGFDPAEVERRRAGVVDRGRVQSA